MNHPNELVEPHYERETDNAPGSFYVEKGQCILCGFPPTVAPKNITWSKETFKRGSEDCPTHCRVERQPETLEEIEQTVEAALGSCIECIRYCGTDPEILRKFIVRGREELCDALSRKKSV